MNNLKKARTTKVKWEQWNGTMSKEEKSDPFFYCFLHVIFSTLSFHLRAVLKIEKPAFFTKIALTHTFPKMKTKQNRSFRFASTVCHFPTMDKNVTEN